MASPISPPPDTVVGAEAFEPTHALTTAGHGPSCAASTDFCLFCKFSDGESDGLVAQLKGLVRALHNEKKELGAIVDAVHRAYNDGIRDQVEWTRPSGAVVAKPQWSKTAIRRHILFSNEFTGLFDEAVDQIFQSLIWRYNNCAVDASSGLPNEEHRKALVDTIAQYAKWQQHCRRCK